MTKKEYKAKSRLLNSVKKAYNLYLEDQGINKETRLNGIERDLIILSNELRDQDKEHSASKNRLRFPKDGSSLD